MKKELINNLVIKHKNYETDSSVITSIGKEEIQTLKELSDILDNPVSELMSGEETLQNRISESLLEIKTEADKINPNKFNLSPGWFGRFLNALTGSNAINKYATKYSSVKSTIESIIISLDQGIELLKNDNFTFSKDRERFRKSADSLMEKIDYLKSVNEELDLRIKEEQDEDTKKFLSENVSFDLKGHIIDLQTIHSAAQQGLVALDILISNNEELIKNVERTKNITVTVLSIGFTIATGLANQKKVLDTTNAVNETTSKIMLQNSEMLKTQGVEIQKQASSALLNLEDMEKALNNLDNAVSDIDNFKRESLPKMQETIDRFSEISGKINNKLLKTS